MGIKLSSALLLFLGIFFSVTGVCPVNGGETCTSIKNGRYVQEYCDYGCCGSGSSEYCCTISTSVLVVACIVSGLVLIALITAIVICCYKNYKDKQANRVRRVRQQEEMNAPRVPGVEPPKPPSYVSAPPAYSENMPESHFRPQTVTGNIPYNQRFRGTTPLPRGPAAGQATASYTRTSGRNPVTRPPSYRATQIPGAVEVEAPPPYTEYARGQTPAHRRRRFIRTPVTERSEVITEQNEANDNNNNNENNNQDVNTDIFSEVTQVSETPGPIQHSRAQETRLQSSRTDAPRAITSRALESRVVSTRANESRAGTVRENESRAESVARILRPSRISRIPTRVQGAQSRQLNDVTSRASSVSTHGHSLTNARVSAPSASTSLRGHQSVVDELAVV